MLATQNNNSAKAKMPEQENGQARDKAAGGDKRALPAKMPEAEDPGKAREKERQIAMAGTRPNSPDLPAKMPEGADTGKAPKFGKIFRIITARNAYAASSLSLPCSPLSFAACRFRPVSFSNSSHEIRRPRFGLSFSLGCMCSP
ncbi:MAG TPA: hypothetical protein VE079_07435 [Ensifer sp.]|nr:hypothetical protein [Ensifer sp.]